ncbi:MAG: hypothetical protein M3Y87_34180 [Myxococcota bacterium]|nr:hypothetical protein [Myxococcota bacterium]
MTWTKMGIAAALVGATALVGCDEIAPNVDERPGEEMGWQEFPDRNRETDGFGPIGDQGSFTEQRMRQEGRHEEAERTVGDQAPVVDEQR